MFEVLVFVYENYWRGDACPEPAHLERKLNAVGFETGEIQEALAWLNGLNLAAYSTQHPADEPVAAAGAVFSDTPVGTAFVVAHPSKNSMRIYSPQEQDHLGAECLGFITFLENAQVLPSHMREVVVDRAMAVPDAPVTLDDLKIIILMVYWSFGQEPDALVLDELCDDSVVRVAH